MAEREFTSLSRIKPYRDAKSIIIATEGELTERDYFEDLAVDERIRHPSVKVKVLPTIEGHSAPEHVIRRLDRIRREHRFYEGDLLWLVIDKDSWDDSKLSRVAQLVSQKKYHLADSNPCFELWLLLHHRSLNCYTDSELRDLKENRKAKVRSSRRRLDLELMKICGSYDSSNLKTSDYIPYVDTAVVNAKTEDSKRGDRWLNQIGSRVYKLVQSIIDSSPNNSRH